MHIIPISGIDRARLAVATHRSVRTIDRVYAGRCRGEHSRRAVMRAAQDLGLPLPPEPSPISSEPSPPKSQAA